MARVRVSFEEWDKGSTRAEAKEKLVGFKEITTHMIFDIKIGDLVRKCRLVADGHKIEPDVSTITYSSVVSRDSIRILFMYAALNDLELNSADIGNAYLNAPCRSKYWTVAGPEFGSDEGKVYIIVRALYGLPCAGSSWRAFFAEILENTLGFVPTRADPDVYRRRNVRPDGTAYYEMFAVWVDDILILSHDTAPIIAELMARFRLKEDSLGAPMRYLGGQIKIFTDTAGIESWALASDEYVQLSIAKAEEDLSKVGRKLRGKAQRPYDVKYRPEMDISPELNADGITLFQGYIGVFRWMIELGRIDILTEVSCLSAYQAAPREGHLEACYHIFAYLKRAKHCSIVMHPGRPNLPQDRFVESADWKDFYGDIAEEVPPDAPPPLGQPVKIVIFVDANHAGNVVTRRSHTGYVIYVNNAPILWYSKRQNTVESSTFGSELIAMRTVAETNDSLRYKLRMFGIPIEGESDVYCDNQSVVNSGTRPECVLSKKHLAICYHIVRESVAKGATRIGKCTDPENIADLLTKIVAMPKREYCLAQLIWRKPERLRDVDREKDLRLNKGS